MIAVVFQAGKRRPGPFDAVDGKTVPAERILNFDSVAVAAGQETVGVDHIIPGIGDGVGKIVIINFNAGRAKAKSAADC